MGYSNVTPNPTKKTANHLIHGGTALSCWEPNHPANLIHICVSNPGLSAFSKDAANSAVVLRKV